MTKVNLVAVEIDHLRVQIADAATLDFDLDPLVLDVGIGTRF